MYGRPSTFPVWKGKKALGTSRVLPFFCIFGLAFFYPGEQRAPARGGKRSPRFFFVDSQLGDERATMQDWRRENSQWRPANPDPALHMGWADGFS